MLVRAAIVALALHVLGSLALADDRNAPTLVEGPWRIAAKDNSRARFEGALTQRGDDMLVQLTPGKVVDGEPTWVFTFGKQSGVLEGLSVVLRPRYQWQRDRTPPTRQLIGWSGKGSRGKDEADVAVSGHPYRGRHPQLRSITMAVRSHGYFRELGGGFWPDRAAEGTAEK